MSGGYSDLTPQQKAARASAQARRERAQEAKARAERHARYDLGGAPGHPWGCVCEACEAVRLSQDGTETDDVEPARCAECGGHLGIEGGGGGADPCDCSHDQAASDGTEAAR